MTVEHEESKKGESDDGSDVEVVTTLRETKVASLRSGVGFGDLALVDAPRWRLSAPCTRQAFFDWSAMTTSALFARSATRWTPRG